MDTNTSTTRFRYRLLTLLLGIFFIVQACSAFYLKLDQTVSSHDIILGNSVTCHYHAYDRDDPEIAMTSGTVRVWVLHLMSGRTISNDIILIHDAGEADYTFTPTETGQFSIIPYATVNYSTIAGLPPVGPQTVSGRPAAYINVTSLAVAMPKTVMIAHYGTGTSTTATTVPVVTFLPVTTTAPVPVAPTAQQTTQVTHTRTGPVPPVASADSIPPVTTLTLTGMEDGSGGYVSEVTCTLTAADNAGGSGVGTTQYSFDGTSWYTYTKPVSVIKAGMTTLYFRSADNAGNTEVAKVRAIVVSRPAAGPAGTAATLVYGTPSVATASPGIVPSYPLPLWLVALIVFVLLAVAGGALFLKSRPKEEPKK